MLLDLTMRKSILKYLIIAITLFFLVDCKQDDDIVGPSSGPTRKDYYPIQVGNEWSYDVMIINKNLSTEDTSRYQLKEVLFELVDSSSRERLYSVYRYKRDIDLADWLLDSVWTVVESNDYIIKKENGVNFQKLIFPASEGASWDGNAWNSLEALEYNIIGTELTNTINDIVYDETMLVRHYEDVNLISSQKEYEIYGKGIGLLEVYRESLETQPGQNSLGSIYSQKLLEVSF